ncbi:MAG: hypothetical protein ATN36_08575 [Epulopiscium sp. Nele67-Bin005]|nr:MAG: hypothetical protein ATN36_08575 [Epulopiscium sp. Nele67-Bin005]
MENTNKKGGSPIGALVGGAIVLALIGGVVNDAVTTEPLKSYGTLINEDGGIGKDLIHNDQYNGRILMYGATKVLKNTDLLNTKYADQVFFADSYEDENGNITILYKELAPQEYTEWNSNFGTNYQPYNAK